MAHGKRINPHERNRVVRLLKDGFSRPHIREVTGVSLTSIDRIRKGFAADPDSPNTRDNPNARFSAKAARRYLEESPPPKAYAGDLNEAQVEALCDFEVWCERYESMKLTPHQRRWIHEAAEQQYALIFAPPGSGKSFLISVQRTCWKLAGGGFPEDYYRSAGNPLRNRLLALISKSESQAGKNFDGIEARLTGNRGIIRDFGRFREPGLTWTKSQGNRKLVVAGREHEKATGDPSLRVMSGDSAALGFRVDELIIDDLADLEACATADKVDHLLDKFRAEFATRRQGGSKIFVIMARLPIPHCPSRFFESLRAVDEDGEPTERPLFKISVDAAVSDWKRKKMLWPADVPGFMGWRELMEQRVIVGERVWETMYMQNPLPGDVSFAEKVWITGDDTHPGCLDTDRTWGQTATLRLAGQPVPTVRVCSVDPSPTKYAGCLLMDIPLLPESSYEPILIDIQRSRLPTPALLALFDRWKEEYDYPVLVLEGNAAHGLMQSSEFQDFRARTGIRLIVHKTTGENKHHTDYGLSQVSKDVEFGKIRIPWGDHDTRAKFQILIDELTRNDRSGTSTSRSVTNDVLMAIWFPKWQLAGLHAMGGMGDMGGFRRAPGPHMGPPPRMSAVREPVGPRA